MRGARNRTVCGSRLPGMGSRFRGNDVDVQVDIHDIHLRLV